jgi:glutamine synthetase
MVKSIAEKHGLRATFMPKPFDELTGNGCHAHASLWDLKKKKNHFLDQGNELGLSKMGYHFIGGIMKSVDSFSAWFNPSLNSYDRLNAKTTNSGSTYSPTAVTYSGNNRTHMIRIPDAGRIEFRPADGAVNPYLLQAGLIAMGLDGIKNKRNPGKRIDVNMYSQGHKLKRIKKLPQSLIESLNKFKASEVVKKSIGSKVVSQYLKLKKREIAEHNKVSDENRKDWERKNIIDC